MDIVGLGIKIVKQLIATGLVHDVADLYSLQRQQLLELEGFAEKKADNLLLAVETSKSQPLARLVTALGIHGVGEVVASDLAQNFHDLDSLSKAKFEELQTIEGIGPNIAQGIVDWFARPANQHVITKLRASGVWPVEHARSREAGIAQVFGNMTFVVTGTLAGFSRDEIKEFIERRGGKVTDSVSIKTSYLVLGENPGSKLDKARSLGIPILDENQLQSMAGVA
jgi:DNA ligase (NAD+)